MPFSANNDGWSERFIQDLSRDERERSSGDTAEVRADDDVALGRLVVERGLLPADALETCLRERDEGRARGRTVPLGELLVQKGLLKMESLIALLLELRRAAEAMPALTRYDLHELLGEGATAVVYRARDREVRRFVALKVLRPSAAMSDVARER